MDGYIQTHTLFINAYAGAPNPETNGSCWCARVYLQYGHLVPQLTLLFGGEAQLVDDFDGHVPASLPVLSCSGDEIW